ncbi:MAG: N-acetylneuraminate synthase family protein [Planctomycetes bacterium]|nr:N-acetylneuraminate synthase family protein [Planctomycetota bacterium]
MQAQIHIGSKTAGAGHPVFVIAEAGVNHNGDVATALRLIDVAAEAGADAVKFQTYRARDLVAEETPLADYQRRGAASAPSMRALLEELELPDSAFLRLKEHCERRNVIFLSTPHTEDAATFLAPLVPAFKLGSGDLTNRLLIEQVGAHRKPVILSTGMATLDEVKRALGWLHAWGTREIAALHCTTSYPCAPEDANLDAMLAMKKELGCVVGYSDHTLGTDVALMAATLGAAIIEKHFTLDRGQAGPDHAASLAPSELARLVEAIRLVPRVHGDARKHPAACELPMIALVRKSLYARAAIPAGTTLKREHLTAKRPAKGIGADRLGDVLGKKAKVDIEPGTQLAWELLLE